MRARFVVACILAAVCAATLAFRAYVDFDRVRIRVVKAPLPQDDPQFTLQLPDVSALAGQHGALIVRVRGVVDGAISVALNGDTLGAIDSRAGQEVRGDFSFVPREGSNTLAFAADHGGWTLDYVEVSNVHGQSRGVFDFVIVPRARPSAAPFAWGALIGVFALLLSVSPATAWPAARKWRWGYRVVAWAAALLMLSTLVAPWLSPFKVLFAVHTVLILTAVLYLERIVFVLRVFLRRLAFLRPVVDVFRPSPALEPAMAPPLPAPREIAAATLGFVLITVGILHTQVRQMGSVPDLGDPLFSIWRMGWVAHQLTSDPRHLFDANIFFPERGTLTYSDSMLLPAMVNAVLTSLGMHPVTAYNLLLLAAFVLSGMTTYVLARSFGWNVPGAWTAGFIFAFAPFRFEHYPHLELQMSFWMPLVLLAVHRLVWWGERRWLSVVTLALVAQWYSSMYFGLFLSVYGAVYGAVLMAGRDEWRRPALRLAAAFVIAALAVAPLGAVYSRHGDTRGERDPVVVQGYSATPGDYLQSTDRRALYAWMRWGEPVSERQLFPGVAPIALAVAGAWPPLSPTRAAALVAGLVAFDGSLGYNGLWYPAAYAALFPFQSIRVPARFAILVMLSLAILSGAAVHRWTRELTRQRRHLAFAVVAAGLAADAWPSLTLVPVWRDAPPIYAPLRSAPDAVLLEYPLDPVPEAFAENLPSMYFSMNHWKPMINGYSGYQPARYAEIVEQLKGFPGGQTLVRARELGVTHVSVVCALDGEFAAFGVPRGGSPGCLEVVATLDRSNMMRPLVRTDWNGSPAVLYEFVR